MRQKFFIFLLFLAIAGCASKPPSPSKFAWELYSSPAVTAGSFSGQSVAILPAVKIIFDPNQEIYRETIAGLLYAALRTDQNAPRLIPVDVLQSRINAAGLWGAFL